jgi:hypothetical protein
LLRHSSEFEKNLDHALRLIGDEPVHEALRVVGIDAWDPRSPRVMKRACAAAIFASAAAARRSPRIKIVVHHVAAVDAEAGSDKLILERRAWTITRSKLPVFAMSSAAPVPAPA